MVPVPELAAARFRPSAGRWSAAAVVERRVLLRTAGGGWLLGRYLLKSAGFVLGLPVFGIQILICRPIFGAPGRGRDSAPFTVIGVAF